MVWTAPLLGIPQWVFALGGLSFLWFSYTAYDVYCSRRGAVPVMDASNIVKSERAALRYPATTLKGFDVTVRNYYVKENTENKTKKNNSWWSIFSNERNTVNKVTITEKDEVCRRIITRDGKDNETIAKKPIAAANWPPGTQKYSALVIEPSLQSGQDVEGGHGRDSLRWLADNATEQSLVKCNPFSTALDMCCEGDASYLGAPYLRVMLAGLLYLPSNLPSWRVAVLGAGGGSLPNFLQKYFSRKISQLDLVDIEPQCFRAAVEQLGMTEDLNQDKSGTVRMFAVDAAEYLKKGCGISVESYGRKTENGSGGTRVVFSPLIGQEVQPLHVLFVDLFIGSELSSHVTSHQFISNCKGALAQQGVVVFNLPEANPLFVERCKTVFGPHNIFLIPAPLSSNKVMVARKASGYDSGLTAGAPSLTHRQLYYKAKEFQQLYHLPYDISNHFPVWWRFW